MHMETTLKIERIPHGVVLRDSKNAVFITRRDMKELRASFRHQKYDMLGKTFISMSTIDGVLFMDRFNNENIMLTYSEVMELIK